MSSLFFWGSMLVLKLLQKNCPERIPYSVGAKLGDGADGEVFNIADQPDKVVKFCVLYETGSIKLETKYKSISNVLSYLVDNPSPVYARVYVHDFMGSYTRTVWGNKQQRYFLYYYATEKLEKISEDEYRVFNSLVSHEDRKKKKDFTPQKVKEMLAGLSRGLDFDAERVTFFHDNLRKSSVIHLDVHPRNIMKDSIGNFKLVDFDRTQLVRRK